jgi:hypothetical protein
MIKSTATRASNLHTCRCGARANGVGAMVNIHRPLAIVLLLFFTTVAEGSRVGVYRAWESAQLRRGVSDPIWGGLAGYYALDGNAYDEVSGETGNWRADVVETNVVPFAAAGTAASFNQDNESYITTLNPTLIDGAFGYTISMWIYPRAYTASAGFAVSRGSGTIRQVFAFHTTTDGRIFFSARSEGSEDNVITPVADAIPLNEWSHIVAVAYSRDGSRGRSIYINGKLSADDSRLVEQTYLQEAVFNLGRDLAASGRRLDGIIDEVGFWRRALSDDEIKRLHDEQLIYRP